MSNTVYYIISAVLSLLVLLGIRWMSKVPTAVRGNRLSALAMLVAIIIVLLKENILTDVYVLIGLAIGLVVGIVMAQRVKMITMPQMVACSTAWAAWPRPLPPSSPCRRARRRCPPLSG